MRVWTEDQKQRQREAIRAWSPWKASTGPRTVRGKAISSQNAYKHGIYSVNGRKLSAWLYHQRLYIRQVEILLKDLKRQKNRIRQNELLKEWDKQGIISPPVFPEVVIGTSRPPPCPSFSGFST